MGTKVHSVIASAKHDTMKDNREMTTFEFEFDDVRTSNVFNRFEILRMF